MKEEKTLQKRNIIQKISDFISLEKDDYEFLTTLSISELIQFIRLYDANIEFISDYINQLAE